VPNLLLGEGEPSANDSFCSDKHRRLYETAHRDPAQVAAYMKAYRAERKRRTTKAKAVTTISEKAKRK
jgi:hypothetical protein